MIFRHRFRCTPTVPGKQWAEYRNLVHLVHRNELLNDPKPILLEDNGET